MCVHARMGVYVHACVCEHVCVCNVDDTGIEYQRDLTIADLKCATTIYCMQDHMTTMM